MDLLAARRRSQAALACRGFLFAAAVGALSSTALAAQREPEFVGKVDPFLRAAIAKAFTLALEKLGRESCLEIFSEFHGRDGLPLTSQLEALDRTATAQLALIRFADGAHDRTCSESAVFAFTHPRTATVYVCGQRFGTLAHTHPALAAALILHEELHSLGLGENPPESREITSSVMQRCGY